MFHKPFQYSIGATALCIMLTLILSAVVRPYSLPPALVVAWGSQGGVPAAAFVANREGIVLLPGSPSDAKELTQVLANQYGVDTATGLFLPTAAPFPSGAQLIAQSLQLRHVTVAVNKRSHTAWQELTQSLQTSGTAITLLNPSEDGATWSGKVASAEVRFHKLPDGAFKCDYDLPAGPCVLQLLETGEFAVTFNNQTRKFPKTNLPGHIKLPTESNSAPQQ